MVQRKSKKIDCILDQNTFGKTLACHYLVDLLNGDTISPYTKHRALSLINSNIGNFKLASTITEYGFKHHVMRLLRQDIFNSIEKLDCTEIVKSLICNVIIHHYRKYLGDAAHRSDKFYSKNIDQTG